MDAQVSEGKWHRLRSLADGEGRFNMMAIDQIYNSAMLHLQF